MPSIKINGKLEYDFEGYIFGDTFEFSLEFFSDDKFLVPQDITGWQFIFDLSPINKCGNPQPQTESLSVGNGITIGPGTNVLYVSKILVSEAGTYNQSLRSIEIGGRTITREQGTLLIDPKI